MPRVRELRSRHELQEEASLPPHLKCNDPQVEVTRRGVYVTDLDSTNGTYINDRSVPSRATLLRPGDELSLGDQVRV